MAEQTKPKVVTEDTDGIRVLRVLDRRLGWDANAQLLKQALVEAVGEAPCVAVDMSEVSYLASPTIGTILSFARDVSEDGRRVAFFGMQPYVHDTFVALRLEKVLDICQKRREAIQRLLSTP